tara:strand:+ start:7340 stop:8437 length:1098 start_codon:yes stop_codon:yes gene_type:complete
MDSKSLNAFVKKHNDILGITGYARMPVAEKLKKIETALRRKSPALVVPRAEFKTLKEGQKEKVKAGGGRAGGFKGSGQVTASGKQAKEQPKKPVKKAPQKPMASSFVPDRVPDRVDRPIPTDPNQVAQVFYSPGQHYRERQRKGVKDLERRDKKKSAGGAVPPKKEKQPAKARVSSLMGEGDKFSEDNLAKIVASATARADRAKQNKIREEALSATSSVLNLTLDNVVQIGEREGGPVDLRRAKAEVDKAYQVLVDQSAQRDREDQAKRVAKRKELTEKTKRDEQRRPARSAGGAPRRDSFNPKFQFMAENSLGGFDIIDKDTGMKVGSRGGRPNFQEQMRARQQAESRARLEEQLARGEEPRLY